MGNRTEEIRVRLTPEEKRDLKVLADATGVPISVIVRAFIFGTIRGFSTGGPYGDSAITVLDIMGLTTKVPKTVSEEEANE